MLSAVPLLFSTLSNILFFISYFQLICSRKNKTQEVKQKIIEFLEGKDAHVKLFFFFFAVSAPFPSSLMFI